MRRNRWGRRWENEERGEEGEYIVTIVFVRTQTLRPMWMFFLSDVASASHGGSLKTLSFLNMSGSWGRLGSLLSLLRCSSECLVLHFDFIPVISSLGHLLTSLFETHYLLLWNGLPSQLPQDLSIAPYFGSFHYLTTLMHFDSCFLSQSLSTLGMKALEDKFQFLSLLFITIFLVFSSLFSTHEMLNECTAS